MKRRFKLYKEACEHDMKVYDAFMKDGAFETVKCGIKELQSVLFDVAEKARKESLKKSFFIGTTAGAGWLLFLEKKKNKELKKKNNED